jgi:16S rRNA G966 N2-methylase RsmD
VEVIIEENKWVEVGKVLFSRNNNISTLRIELRNHVYEMQECRFIPVMEKFALLIDGIFTPSRYDSLERLLKLDEVSKSHMCSEKEKVLIEEIERLKLQLDQQNIELIKLKLQYNDARLVMFDGV